MATGETPREFLRHTLATVAYRSAKALRDVPPGFGDFSVALGSRTPGEILAHLGDLYDWALSMAHGQWVWRVAPVLPWEQGAARFFSVLSRLDEFLASNEPMGHPPERIFQGAIADSLTHIGQISYLRRLAGAPVRGESYARAEIVVGRTGAEQAASRVEFD